MAKYGSPSGGFLFEGYDMTANKLQGLRVKKTGLTEPSTGVGDSWEENLPTELKRGELAQEGAFFDTTAARIHDQWAETGSLDTDPNGTPGSAVVFFNGGAIGADFTGFEGGWKFVYEPISTVGALTRANAEYMVTGNVDEGKVVHALGNETASGDTESTSVDGTAQSTAGGACYLQTTLITGAPTSFTVTFRDSSDDVVYGDLQAMTAQTAFGAERIEITGTVERYLAVAWAFVGGTTPTATFFAGFARY
jgi:hypothetical protein